MVGAKVTAMIGDGGQQERTLVSFAGNVLISSSAHYVGQPGRLSKELPQPSRTLTADRRALASPADTTKGAVAVTIFMGPTNDLFSNTIRTSVYSTPHLPSTTPWAYFIKLFSC
jgi:hypothetical protein